MVIGMLSRPPLQQGARSIFRSHYGAPMGTTPTAHDIAVAFRNRLRDRAIYVSDRKIHALLYLAQYLHLTVEDDPLFDEPVVATDLGAEVGGLTDEPGRPVDDTRFGVVTLTASRYGGLPAMDLEALIRGQGPWSATSVGERIRPELSREHARAQAENPEGTIAGWTRSERAELRRPAGAPSPNPGTPDSTEEIAAFVADVKAGNVRR